jgi:prepilin-type N-terminal cleavage/methylation domain-containing protein
MPNKKLGFSLLELSIVLLVIALLMIGVTKTSELIAQAKIGRAREITAKSPVLEINGLISWWEPTLSSSFLDSEVKDASAISTWNDISGNKVPYTLSQATSGNRPLYTQNAINDLPALKFNGSTSFMSNTTFQMPYANYTIFAVFNLTNNSSIRDVMTLGTGGQNGAIIEVQTSGVVRALHRFPYSASGGDDLTSASSQISINTNYMFSYVRNLTAGTSLVKLNSTIAINSTATIQTFDSTNLTISLGTLSGSSRFFQGYISELIIFNRALSDQEKSDVEAYLGQKYNITVS